MRRRVLSGSSVDWAGHVTAGYRASVQKISVALKQQERSWALESIRFGQAVESGGCILRVDTDSCRFGLSMDTLMALESTFAWALPGLKTILTLGSSLASTELACKLSQRRKSH